MIAVLFVDRFGRRFMLIEGGTQCAIAQVRRRSRSLGPSRLVPLPGAVLLRRCL